MSHNEKFRWDRLDNKTYVQQRTEEPQSGRTPNNTIGTINHFSKKRTLRKYTTLSDYDENDDGYAKRLDYEEVDFWCVIKAVSNSVRSYENTSLNEIEGIYNDGELLLYYNPFHPNYGSDNEDGVHAQIANEQSMETDYNGFGDVIEYHNELWLITSRTKLDVDYDVDEAYIGKCLLKLWEEQAHTKNKDNVVFKPHHYEIT